MTRRMLSSSISTSQKVSKISLLAKLIYTWIIPNCDDYGQIAGDADSIHWEVVPRIDISNEEVEKCLEEIEEIGLGKRWAEDGKTYLKISNFDDFQTFKNDRLRKSIIKKKR
mgnify:FL=1